jgi:PAS domain S-box-containing protein
VFDLLNSDARGPFARYGLSVAAAVIAAAIQLAFQPILGGLRFFAFFPAILITAAMAGLGPALFAVALSCAAVFILGPHNGAIQIAFFALFASLTSWLMASYRREMLRMRAARVRDIALVANSAPVMIWTSNADGAVTFVNERWNKFTGGADHDGATHSDDLARARDAFASAFAQRKPLRVEYRLRRADGVYRWVSDSAVPRFTEDGRFEGYIGTCLDIDELKSLQQAADELTLRLQNERQRLQNIVSSVPGVVWEAWGTPDQSSQRINYVSDEVTRMLGYSVEEWLANPNFWLTIVHPDDRDAAAANALEHFVRGGPGTNTFRWMTKDGRPLWVESHSTVIHDDAGNAIGMRGVTLDISARKRAEESLRLLVEVSEVLTSSLDYEIPIRTATEMSVKVIGDWCAVSYGDSSGTARRLTVAHADPVKHVIAQKLMQIPPRTDLAPHEVGVEVQRATILSMDEATIDRTTASPEHAAIIRELGVASVLVAPMMARGRLIGAMTYASSTPNRYDSADAELALLIARRAAIAIDNAELHRAALDANRMKDEFLATVSHELRTPMTATLGWVRMLTMGTLDNASQLLAYESIERSTRAQARLIDDILDVSSIITGKFRLEVAPVDLRTVIAHAIETVRPAAAAKQIAIDTDLGETAFIVPGDPNRLQQVVWNLVNNAIKFGRRGGAIGVRMARVGTSARIIVNDDGIGIAPEFLPHVFERFRQADASLTRSHGGLGLGLAIVRHLVELHGGTVQAESAGRGHGATFIVELPLAGAEPQQLSLVDKVLPRLDSKRVLVVDDEDDARQMVAAVLRECGADVTLAASADEAMVKLRDDHDLLITDIAMPGGDGFSLIERVTLPIKKIALTAIADVAGGAAFDEVLHKPIDPIDLAHAVARILA